MTLFKKLSKRNQKKVSDKLTIYTINRFKEFEIEEDITIHLATDVFWAIYPKRAFDLTEFYNLFDKNL